MDCCREIQGPTTACSNMPKRDGTAQGEDSSKQACSFWFVRHSLSVTIGANWYLPGVCFSGVMLSFSGVTYFLLYFIFVFFDSIGAVDPRSIVLRDACAPTATRSHLTTICVFFFSLCVCVFIKLHITAQSGAVILAILCHSH